jgi:hypothetical protein
MLIFSFWYPSRHNDILLIEKNQTRKNRGLSFININKLCFLFVLRLLYFFIYYQLALHYCLVSAYHFEGTTLARFIKF